MVTAELEEYAQAVRDALGGECVRVFTHWPFVAVEYMTRSGRMMTTLQHRLDVDWDKPCGPVALWEARTSVQIDCDNPAELWFTERRGYICEALSASLRRVAVVFSGPVSDVAAHFGKPFDAGIIHDIALDVLTGEKVSAW